MSIRFHKGAPLITLFHDPGSQASQRALALLTRSVGGSGPASQASSSQQAAPQTDASRYLNEASAPPASGVRIQLEVQDRNANPPTSAQMRSILQYLKNGPGAPAVAPIDPHPAAQSQHQGAAANSAAEGAGEGAATEGGSSLKAHLEQGSSSGGDVGAPRLRSGPLVVNWDEGWATTSVEGVQAMLAKMEQEQEQAKDGGGCVVA